MLKKKKILRDLIRDFLKIVYFRGCRIMLWFFLVLALCHLVVTGEYQMCDIFRYPVSRISIFKSYPTQKMRPSIKDFFRLLKKSRMETFIFRTVLAILYFAESVDISRNSAQVSSAGVQTYGLNILGNIDRDCYVDELPDSKELNQGHFQGLAKHL